MRWRITVRNDNVELRGYIDAPLSDLERMAEVFKPVGIMIASPADPDYDAFSKPPPNDGSKAP